MSMLGKLLKKNPDGSFIAPLKKTQEEKKQEAVRRINLLVDGCNKHLMEEKATLFEAMDTILTLTTRLYAQIGKGIMGKDARIAELETELEKYAPKQPEQNKGEENKE